MIREGIIAAAVVSIGATSALAETVFKGSLRFTAVTAQCQNVHVGDKYTSSFHPFLAGQTDHSEGISLVYQFGGWGYQLNNHAFDATFRPVISGGLGWGGVYTQPSSQWAQIGAVTHAAITNTTQTLVLKGKIKRHDFDPGGLACIADFVAVYFKEQ